MKMPLKQGQFTVDKMHLLISSKVNKTLPVIDELC